MNTAARLEAAGLSAATVLWLYATLLMLQPLSTDLYIPALPAIATHFDASVATTQTTLSVFVAGFGLWQLVAGPLSDRYGRRPVVLAGAATYFAASLLCMTAQSMTMLVAGRLLQAIGACSCIVGARAIVRDLFRPAEGARLLARGSMIMSAAPLVGPVLGAHLLAILGWRSSFALLAAASAALLGFAAWQLRETNTRPDPRALAPRPMLANYARVARSAAFRAYTLVAATSYAGLFAYISGLSFVLVRVHGAAPTAVGWSFATMVAGYLAGTAICQRLLARTGLQRVVLIGACLQGAAGLALAGLAVAGAHSPAALVVPMVVYGLSHGLVTPPCQSGAVAPFPHNAGAAAALFGACLMAAAAAMGTWIGGSFDGTIYPLSLSIAAASACTILAATVLVRRDGDVSHHD